ncbi:MAG: hypothetical protein AB7S26_37240 [Sandaracinaceae bacterium]
MVALASLGGCALGGAEPLDLGSERLSREAPVGAVPARDLEEIADLAREDPEAALALEGMPTEQGETHWELIECPSRLHVSASVGPDAPGTGDWRSSVVRTYDVNELFSVERAEEVPETTLYCAHRTAGGVITAEVTRSVRGAVECLAVQEGGLFVCRVLDRIDDGWDEPATCSEPTSGFGENVGSAHRNWSASDEHGEIFTFYDAAESAPLETFCRYRFHVIVQHYIEQGLDEAEASALEAEVTARFAERGVRVITRLWSRNRPLTTDDLAAWRAEHGQSSLVVGELVRAPSAYRPPRIVDSEGIIRWQASTNLDRGNFNSLVGALEALLAE